jgi:D-serine deaminase-like pyridoxal phosphate-dependent protein
MNFKNIIIDTPSLLIDKYSLLKNIETMSVYTKENDISIRPHSKSHKISEIAKIQIKYGAIGICVATLHEAEIMVKNKIKGVLLTTPITNTNNKARLASLVKSSKSFKVIIDSLYGLEFMDDIAKNNNLKVNILIDCDIMKIGTNKKSRTGCRNIEEIINLASIVKSKSTLVYRGITAYAGDIQHINNYNKRKVETNKRHNYLKNIKEKLTELKLKPKIISGGGTGSYDIDTKSGLFTELQAGSYIFNDVEYAKVSIYKTKSNPFKNGLFIASTIISIIDKYNYIIDAGLKALSSDSELLPKPIGNVPLGTKYNFMGDEHGKITLPKNSNKKLAYGDIVLIQPAHCDPTVNLYDRCYLFTNNKISKSWLIDARGYG